MFAQVIQGRVSDADTLRRQWERWDRELKPGAEGYLGSTAGISDDGEFIAVARFESEEAARRNSDKPEQTEWWTEAEKCFEGEVKFYDSNDVDFFLDGGSDDAGFVQVIQGRVKDREKYTEMERRGEQWLRENRPEIIGGLRAWQQNDATETVYFTSEAEAREGERKETPSDIAADFGDWQDRVDDMKFIDLRDPWFSSS
jgi:hypothetical protein